MNKNFKILLVVLFSALMFQSCNDTFKKKNNKEERVNWTFSFTDIPNNPLRGYVPAIDESGNIYFFHYDNAFKLNSAGKKIWEKNVGAAGYSRLIYFDNKLYFLSDKLLKCVDAQTGETVWSKEIGKTNINSIVLNSNRIYTVTTTSESLTDTKSTLYAYDILGNKLWEKVIKYTNDADEELITLVQNFSVSGNKIYLACFIEDVDGGDNDAQLAIMEYSDNDDAATKTWTWTSPAETNYDQSIKSYYGDLAIDDNGNILFAMSGNGGQSVYSISNTGVTNWVAPISSNKPALNIVVDGTGNAYTSYDAIEKVANGSKLWTSAINNDWEYGGLTSIGTVISEEGNISSVNLNSILTSVDKEGNVLWEQFYEKYEQGYNEFNSITINRNGDIIVLNKYGVTAYEGDGTALSTKGWPKVYNNYGNTGSR